MCFLGSNFQQLDKNSWLLFRGSVEGVSLATDKVPLSSMNGTRLEIGEELVWKMSYRNYQRYAYLMCNFCNEFLNIYL